MYQDVGFLFVEVHVAVTAVLWQSGQWSVLLGSSPQDPFIQSSNSRTLESSHWLATGKGLVWRHAKGFRSHSQEHLWFYVAHLPWIKRDSKASLRCKQTQQENELFWLANLRDFSALIITLFYPYRLHYSCQEIDPISFHPQSIGN